jgi:AbrB family looped-hinge helix DNA binding protein
VASQILLDRTEKYVRIYDIRIFRKGDGLLFRVILKDRGQLTIPAKLRKSLGLRAGDLLEVEVRGGYMILKPLEVLEREAGKVEESPEEGPAA